MTESLPAGDFRICPSCGSRNKAAYNFCVRCNVSLDATVPRAAGAGVSARPRNSRVKRFLLAAGVIAAIAVGLMVHAVSRATRDVQAIAEDVRADGARTVGASAPPLVTGWSPGANVPVAPEASSGPAHAATQTWSSDYFPVARPNPYDVPGDPNASMVGIAPRAPRVRAAIKRQRVFTDNDLLATRDGGWTTPAPEPN